MFNYMKKKIEIDAKGKKLGRVASQAAVFLMGKNLTNQQRNIVPEISVRIKNASGLQIDSKKKKEKDYGSFSGYPGGLKKESMEKLIDRKGFREILRLAIYGMLPSNKLRAQMLTNLTITE